MQFKVRNVLSLSKVNYAMKNHLMCLQKLFFFQLECPIGWIINNDFLLEFKENSEV